MFLHADSASSDKTGPMPRLIRVFAGRTSNFVGFVMRRLKSCPSETQTFSFCAALFFSQLLLLRSFCNCFKNYKFCYFTALFLYKMKAVLPE